MVVALVSLLLAGCSLLATPAPASPTEPPAAEVPTGFRGGTIGIVELPPEAIDTLLLIEEGGPFPYDQDGAVFQNREGSLPSHPSGYYQEYTVETPGSPDRGARRIVTGADGERYWTDDHYDSFRFVVGELAEVLGE
jgi:ribonuclease T1